MQQLTIEHKKVTTSNKNQKTEQQQVKELVEYENKREGHGRNIALTRNVFRLENSDTFYVQSESKDQYYFIRYEPSFHWCSCLDNSTRHIKCKHIFGLEYAIMKGTLKDIDRLPKEVKRDNMVSKSYREDNYDF